MLKVLLLLASQLGKAISACMPPVHPSVCGVRAHQVWTTARAEHEWNMNAAYPSEAPWGAETCVKNGNLQHGWLLRTFRAADLDGIRVCARGHVCVCVFLHSCLIRRMRLQLGATV